MSNKNESLDNGLGIIFGIAGALWGIGMASEDPEVSTLGGVIIGFIIGYICGRIAAVILSGIIQILVALIGFLLIAIRLYLIFN